MDARWWLRWSVWVAFSLFWVAFSTVKLVEQSWSVAWVICLFCHVVLLGGHGWGLGQAMTLREWRAAIRTHPPLARRDPPDPHERRLNLH
jgi:hypothetical protein